jgi:ATPase subunit of ABC transporter with duplicated ATPase domains
VVNVTADSPTPDDRAAEQARIAAANRQQQLAAQQAAARKAAAAKAAKAAEEKARAEAERKAAERAAEKEKASRSEDREPIKVEPGSAKAIGREMAADRGWGDDQFSCLEKLWDKESGWRVNAENKSSGAYGIPQALPGEKMESVASDWRTNPRTQIEWGLRYVKSRYSTPCKAWSHFQANNWY